MARGVGGEIIARILRCAQRKNYSRGIIARKGGKEKEFYGEHCG